MAAAHYADLSKKPFFGGLVKFFSSGPIVCMCWEGKDIIKQGRQMLGETRKFSTRPDPTTHVLVVAVVHVSHLLRLLSTFSLQ